MPKYDVTVIVEEEFKTTIEASSSEAAREQAEELRVQGSKKLRPAGTTSVVILVKRAQEGQ